MTNEKAKILDDILREFSGNKTISWTDFRNKFGDRTREYHINENNIKYLLGDGMLEENKENETLWLSNKGFATYTDIETLGYVKKFKKERNDNRIKYIGLFITISTFILLLFRTFSVNNKPNQSTIKPTIDSVNKIIPDKYNNPDSTETHIQGDTTTMHPSQ